MGFKQVLDASNGMDGIAELKKNSKSVSGKEEIAQVATISAENIQMGQMIADVISEVGKDGVVTVEESQTFGLEKEIVEEMFENVISLHPWLRGNFAAVNILFEDARFTLIPMPLFDQNNYQSIYAFNFTNIIGEEVLYTAMPVSDAVLIYGISNGLIESFKKRYPFVNFYHSNFPLWTAFINKYRNTDSQGSVLANFRNGAMDILILNERKLQLMNSFSCKSDEDFLYFLIFELSRWG